MTPNAPSNYVKVTTTLLDKSAADGRALLITWDGAFATVSLAGKVVGTGPIDRRSHPSGAARMAKMPADVVAVIAGKLAVKADDLAKIEDALAVHDGEWRMRNADKLAREFVQIAADAKHEEERIALERRMAHGEI